LISTLKSNVGSSFRLAYTPHLFVDACILQPLMDAE
jgi:hypothetical protein